MRASGEAGLTKGKDWNLKFLTLTNPGRRLLADDEYALPEAAITNSGIKFYSEEDTPTDSNETGNKTDPEPESSKNTTESTSAFNLIISLASLFFIALLFI